SAFEIGFLSLAHTKRDVERLAEALRSALFAVSTSTPQRPGGGDPMTLKRDPSKALQLGFLALLLVSTVQVGWWMYDHVSQARDVERRFAAEYRHDADAVTALFAGASAEEVAKHLPSVAVLGASASVRPEALA